MKVPRPSPRLGCPHESLSKHLRCRVQDFCRQFNQDAGLPFSDVLPAETILDALREQAVAFRDRLFTPLVTLWLFLSQVLSKDHSCLSAVARFLAYRTGQGL